MILCDSNVWLALSIDNHVHHEAAIGWLETISEAASLNFCRSTQQSFLRLLTLASVFAPFGEPPLSNQRAWNVYQSLLADSRVAFQPFEPSGLEARWIGFASRETASPKLWMDAYLAAFAVSGGYQMVTTDAAFSQFDELDLTLIDSPGR